MFSNSYWKPSASVKFDKHIKCYPNGLTHNLSLNTKQQKPDLTIFNQQKSVGTKLTISNNKQIQVNQNKFFTKNNNRVRGSPCNRDTFSRKSRGIFTPIRNDVYEIQYETNQGNHTKNAIDNKKSRGSPYNRDIPFGKNRDILTSSRNNKYKTLFKSKQVNHMHSL